MPYRSLLIGLVIILLVCGWLLISAYEAVRHQTVLELNERQAIHARQASSSIERFAREYILQLENLADHKSVARMTPYGKDYLRKFHERHSRDLKAVTRVSEHGRILHTIPFDERLIGSDISAQRHVSESLRSRKPVISDVFTSVQGYRAIVFAMPVFDGSDYLGTINAVFSADDLASQFLRDIRIGKSGYAWLISKEGIELFCPLPDHIGSSIYKTSKHSPSFIAMAELMMKGEQGSTVYDHDAPQGGTDAPSIRHAVYMPVNLGSTHWSVMVSTAESEVLASMQAFRDRIFSIVAIFSAGLVVCLFLFMKIRSRLNEDRQRQESERMLRESEQKLRSILEHTTNLFYSHGTDHVLTYVSPQSRHFLDCNPEEALADWRTFITDHPMNTKGIETTERALQTGVAQQPHLLELRTRAGRIIWVEVREAPVVRDGRTVAIVGSLTDVTEKIKYERELQRVDKLESLGVLAGGIAHDFNNLLVGILGNISLARLDLEPGSRSAMKLEAAEQACERAKELAMQLLVFSRGGQPVKKTIALGPLLAESVSFSLRGSRSKCETEIEPGLSPVDADEGQISQVMNNLIINAHQAMPDGGAITLRAANVLLRDGEVPELASGKYVRISVADEGIGIPAENLPKIFDPFFTTKKKGTGLGLASVFSIVRNHGGAVAVHLRQPRGTIMEIYLPASSNTISAPQPRSAPRAMSGKGRILVLDDDEAVNAVLTEMLSSMGFETEITRDGHDTIEAYRRSISDGAGFDAVIMDLTIPGGMGGKEAMNGLILLDPSVKAIVSSGYSNDPVMANFRDYGFSGVIAKPYNMEEISSVLHSLLERDND